MNSNRTGVAIKMDEYVPTTTPINSANVKPLMVSPPAKNNTSNTIKVVRAVMIVRLKVVFNALFTITLNEYFLA